jgi:hypothetical protein
MSGVVTEAQLNAAITQLRIEISNGRLEIIEMNMNLQRQLNEVKNALRALADRRVQFLRTNCHSSYSCSQIKWDTL